MSHTKAREFTKSENWIVPDNVYLVHFTAIGGGSGGAGTYQSSGPTGGISGGTGEMVIRWPIRVTPGEKIAITVGAGGAKARTWSDDMFGTEGGPTLFGDRAKVLGGHRIPANGPQGGGPRGGAPSGNPTVNNGIGYLGTLETPFHMGGTGGSAGGVLGAGATAGYPGAGAMGYESGGVGGAPVTPGGGGAGGAATPWGIGGEGGLAYGLSGDTHGPEGDSGGHPPTTNGLPAPVGNFGAGGGGAGGCYASYSAKLIWSGAGAKGYCLLEWVE